VLNLPSTCKSHTHPRSETSEPRRLINLYARSIKICNGFECEESDLLFRFHRLGHSKKTGEIEDFGLNLQRFTISNLSTSFLPLHFVISLVLGMPYPAFSFESFSSLPVARRRSSFPPCLSLLLPLLLLPFFSAPSTLHYTARPTVVLRHRVVPRRRRHLQSKILTGFLLTTSMDSVSGRSHASSSALRVAP
jgi:hypothetical protein